MTCMDIYLLLISPYNILRDLTFPTSNSGKEMSIPHSRPPQAAADNFANTYEKVLDDVKHQGLIYLSTCPGLDKRPMNISLHSSLLRILEANHRPDIEELHCLQKEISYRMHHTYVATIYKNLLGLEFADCHLVSVENHPKNLYWTWISSFLSLRDSSLFDRPQAPGRRYMKGEQYLATCIVEAGWDWLEGVKRLDDLLLYKGKMLQPLFLVDICDLLTRR